MIRIKNIVTFLVVASLGFGTAFAQSKPTTQPVETDTEKPHRILIHNGTVIDGTGSEGYRAHVLISGDTIKEIIPGDKFLTDDIFDEIVDASGKVVAPGFIDPHAHGTPKSTPEFENFLAMGATTILLGSDGSHPFGKDAAKWMDEVEEAGVGPNVGLLVGHGSVRMLEGVGSSTEPTNEQLNAMAARVRKELEAGCFGLSTGLEYEPGRFSNLKELIAIAEPVGELGRLVSSHMRSEDDDKIHEAIAELINQGRGANCRVHISHFKITYGKGKDRANEVLKQVHKARKSGVDITADQYPYPASFTTIGIVFPNWARPPVDFDEVVAERRDELEEYLRNRIAQRNGPEATLFGTAPWAGKTLKDVAEELDKPFEKVLIDDIGPRGASAAYFIMDDDVIETFMADPHTMICSDGSPTMRHPRGYGSFAKIIRYYVNERNVMPLETAIHKMTLLSAKTFGLDKLKRGKIAEGWKADLVIFDPDKVQDNANFENPHQLAEGFDYVFVNGKAARANGEFTEGMYGQVLRHP